MAMIGEVVRIVRDVRTIDRPEIPSEFLGEGPDSLDRHNSSSNLGMLAVIADRMYGLLHETDQSDETKKIITDAYAAWMISVSILDDLIDESNITTTQKLEYLQMGQQTLLGEDTHPTVVPDNALAASLSLFAYAGRLIEESSNGHSQEVLTPYMTALTEAVARQDYAYDKDAQSEIASIMGGICIAAPIIFAEAINGKSYPQEMSASLALGTWAQKIDNIRDMGFDFNTGQLTTEVIKLRNGEPNWRIVFSSLQSARKEFQSATSDLSGPARDMLYAMANLMLVQYLLIHPTKTSLKFGKLTPPLASSLPQQSAL